MQKRNPGRGNAGASQIGDLCLGGGHRQPYLWYRSVNRQATVEIGMLVRLFRQSFAASPLSRPEITIITGR
jgi:hypothetical protein